MSSGLTKWPVYAIYKSPKCSGVEIAERSKLTLTIALQGVDCLALGCDSRGTFGDARSGATAIIDVMIKASVLSPHVGVLMSGAGELGDALVDEFLTNQQSSGSDGVTQVMGQFRAHLAQRWDAYFANVPFQNRPICAFIVAGLNPVDGKYTSPVIYTLVSQLGFAPSLHRYGFACAGIPTFATYILNRRYDRSATADVLAGLVAFAIDETASQDQRVGGPIRVTTITPDGTKSFSDDEIKSLLAKY